MKGKVIGIRPIIRNSKLRIAGSIQTADAACVEALLPAREVAAILPRSILIGDKKKASPKLLETIRAIVGRMTIGRIVRIWKYEDDYYFSFVSWNDVHFEADVTAVAAATETGSNAP